MLVPIPSTFPYVFFPILHLFIHLPFIKAVSNLEGNRKVIYNGSAQGKSEYSLRQRIWFPNKDTSKHGLIQCSITEIFFLVLTCTT
jgi:hypothetical protein